MNYTSKASLLVIKVQFNLADKIKNPRPKPYLGIIISQRPEVRPVINYLATTQNTLE